MTDLKNDIPTRFLFKEDQPKDFWLTRLGSQMKSSEFRKTYNKAVNPYLKENGFKTSGFKALREEEDFY